MIEIGAQPRQFLSVTEVWRIGDFIILAREDIIVEPVAIIAILEVRAQRLGPVLIIIRRVIGLGVDIHVDADIGFLALHFLGVARIHLLGGRTHLLFGLHVLIAFRGLFILFGLFRIVLFLRFHVFARRIGGGQVPDHIAYCACKAGLIVQLRDQTVNCAPSFGFDPFAPDIGHAFRAVRQGAPGQLLAQQKFERRREHRLSVFCAHRELAGLAAMVQDSVEIVGRTAHGIGAQAFDARLFSRVIDLAG